jgi:hypothetical protein
MPKPHGRARNVIIVLVAQQLPDLSQRREAYVVGTDASTVNRVLDRRPAFKGVSSTAGAEGDSYFTAPSAQR